MSEDIAWDERGDLKTPVGIEKIFWGGHLEGEEPQGRKGSQRMRE